jgi:hypothetical protein
MRIAPYLLASDAAIGDHISSTSITQQANDGAMNGFLPTGENPF